MEIRHISASAIKCFETCPHKFYHEYVLRIRGETHPAANAGSAVHYACERAVKAKKNDKREESDPLFWMQEALKKYDVQKAYYENVLTWIKTCVSWGYFDVTNTIDAEHKIDFTLPVGVPVVGFVDKLDIDGNWKASIKDIKTQKNPFTRQELDNNWQSFLYFLGVVNEFPLIQNIVDIEFWCLRHKKQIVQLAKTDYDIILKRVNDKVIEIKESDGTRVCPSGLCRFCVAEGCCHHPSNVLKTDKTVGDNTNIIGQALTDVERAKAILKTLKPDFRPETIPATEETEEVNSIFLF